MSSWIVRLALSHGLKPKPFTTALWPNLIVWGPDIDLSSKELIMTTLAERTNTPIERVRAMTLAAYEGWLFEKLAPKGPTKWILPRNIRERSQRFGLQFCPWCLSEDKESYFRRNWRLSFIVLCRKHKCLLLDRCPTCGDAINFYLAALNDRYKVLPYSLTECHHCKVDLRNAATRKYLSPVLPQEIGFQESLLYILMRGWVEIPYYGPVYSHLYFYALYHIISRFIDSKRAADIQKNFANYFGSQTFTRISSKHLEFEQLNVAERRGLLVAAQWLLDDWPNKFIEFCKQNRLRSSFLIRSRNDLPFWYWNVVHQDLGDSRFKVTEDEIDSIFSYIKKKGLEPNRKELIKYLPVQTAERILREKGLIKEKDYSGKCRRCGATKRQFKSGYSTQGYQYYRCGECHRFYTLEELYCGYPNQVKEEAIRLCSEGHNFITVGRMLSITYVTISKWWKNYQNVKSEHANHLISD